MIPAGGHGDDDAHGTEAAAARFTGLDTWRTGDVLEVLWSSQSRAVAACLSALPGLERAVDAAIQRLSGSSGRLVYAGAGSSGMLAALDALELGPTFNWPEARTRLFVAGGFDLQRGLDSTAEDDAIGGRTRVSDDGLGQHDVVLGISASGTSPYTVAVVDQARKCGALTIGVANRADSPLVRAADHAIVVPTGAEVIAGSTRLAAGTAQKLVLNLFSTGVMIGLGLVFDNLMIEMRPENAKLRQRQAAMVASIARVDRTIAADALARHGDVKRAVLALSGLSDDEIDAALARASGNLRVALRGRSDP